MVVKFSKQNSNYTKQNIIDILTVASMQNQLIYNLMVAPYDYILVEGDIHRSQYTHDNTYNNYWIKIKGFTSEGYPIQSLKAAHIYLCFRQIEYDYQLRNYIIGNCINPPEKSGTDLADISQMRGTWEFVKITYGLSPRTMAKKSGPRKPVPKRKKNVLKIIDPKTGKPIKIGGAPQKGGSGDGGEQTFDEFMATQITKLNLKDDEVNELVGSIQQMKVVTPKKVMSQFQKLLAARGKKSQKRKNNQRGGAKGLTVAEMKKICKKKGIKNYSKLKKAELKKHCLIEGDEKIQKAKVPKKQVKKQTLAQLKKICKKKGIKGYSKLSRQQLLDRCVNELKMSDLPQDLQNIVFDYKSQLEKMPKKLKKNPSFFDILEIVEPGKYTFDTLIDAMGKHYVAKGKYVHDIHDKVTYIYPAIKKAMKQGWLKQQKNIGVKSKYSGHNYIVESH